MPDRLQIAVAIVEHDGRFLVGRRADDGPQGGLAEFPGGKVRPGETPAAAAVRECLEETGLLTTVVSAWSPVRHDYSDRSLEIHFFRAALESPGEADDGLPTPGGNFRWIAREELAAMDFPAANAGILAEVTRP